MTKKTFRGRGNWTPEQGATILEILVVLAIIALLASVVGPRVIGYLGAARSETAGLQIGNLRSAVQMFYIDTGRYPSQSEGLSALITSPAGESRWNGPYMQSETALRDPWDRPYIFEAGEDGAFAIRSLGRDGAQGGGGEDTDLSSQR